MNLPVSPLLLVGCSLLCGGELLHIIGVATTHWLDSSRGDGHIGLFKDCIPNCVDSIDPSSKLKAIRAMEILAILSGFGAIVLAAFIFVRRFTLKPLPQVSLAFCMMAGVAAVVFTLIGIGIFVDDVRDALDADLVELGYSFDLTIVGGVFLVAGGVLASVGGRSSLGGEYSPLMGSR